MPWSGSGTFNLDPSYSPEVNGTVIDALRYNGLTTDIAAGITNALAKDGQNVPTANIPMGGFKFTGLAAGAAPGHSVRYEQANLIGETSITGNATLADIFAAPTARVLFDGTGLTVTAFPASSLNTWKLVRFNGVNTITNGASLICPSSANITTASGDYALVVSVGSTTVVVDYFPVAGRSARLSNLLAAAGTNTINNAANVQVWNWTLTTLNSTGFTIGESSASATPSYHFQASTASGSQASPFRAVWNTSAVGRLGFDNGGGIEITSPSDLTLARTGSVVINGGAGYDTDQAGGPVNVTGGQGIGAGTGGVVQMIGGASTSGQGGNVVLRPGRNNTISAGGVVIEGGPLCIIEQTTKPSVTGAGTGATVAGSDGCFTIDIGTSPTATIVVTFSRAMGTSGARPRVFVQYETTGGSAVVQRVESVSTTGFTINMSAAPSGTGFLHCLVIPTSSAIV